MRTHTTFCRICEATCGLEVDVEANRIVDIRPDPEHVVSRGYACVKGTRHAAVQHSPDRLLRPIKRVVSEWREISWRQAIAEIAEKSTALVRAHGPQGFGHFVGSAGGANVLAPLFRGAFYAALGSTRMYGTGTCDTMNKFRVNGDMYGSPMRLAYPDVDRTRFMLVLGANPAVSGNTLYHLPRARERFAAIVARGGRVVFVNPRRIETAAAGEHLFIRPDTDVYFLAAYANELIRTGGVDRARVERHMRGFDALAETVAAWTPERQAAGTGIPADVLRDLVRSHREARGPGGEGGAALNMATGVNQGRSGTLCYWLLESINAISGNLDRAGGTLMGQGLVDMAKQVLDDPQMQLRHDRDDGLPTVSGQQPAGMLADDILSGRVAGLVVEASNPALACPSPDGRVEEALAKLELLVSIDLFRNETAELAHYVLPATSWLERPEVPYALQSLAGCCPTPYITFADAILEPPPDVRHEWWIYTRLADAMGLTLFGSRAASAGAKAAARLAYTPLGRKLPLQRTLIDGMLRQGGLPSGRKLAAEHPHGLLLPENHGGNFLGTERVLTADGKVDLAPPDFVATFEQRVDALFAEEIAQRDRIKLVGLRQLKRLNTSSCNNPELVREKTNLAYLSPDDAARVGVADGDRVEVTSAFGRIEIPVRVTDEMMPRVVAIPQCWGHAGAKGLGHARAHPGVNSNRLAGDGPDNVERLSGMSHLSGIPVEVRRTEAATSENTP